MPTNILLFLNNLTEVTNFELEDLYNGSNRINNVGEALECFTKDLFCNSLAVNGLDNKRARHSNFLSYSGNQNNPPDFVIEGGDAVEVKKNTNSTSGVALNSSYPKSKLKSDDRRISGACREIEGGAWEKDIIYTVGTMSGSRLNLLWMVYGDCYAADSEVYERPVQAITNHLLTLSNLEVAPTNEIARVNRVDPLGITYLRVRGMWGIDSPHRVFSHLTTYNADNSFSAYALVLESKYNSFPDSDKELVQNNSMINIQDVRIPSPNNPANFLSAKLISIVME